jgi:hypothetical protein
MRRNRRRIELPPDDGAVRLGGDLVDPERAAFNARYHMAGFDDLPKWIRDKINYAETPEAGALPTCDLAGNGRLYDPGERQRARARALAKLREILAQD